MEHGGVGRVGLVLAEHAAGSQHAQRGLVLLHIADLHGAGLGAEQDAVVIGEVEGIGAVAGGVAFLDVQPGEVVVCQLHLGAVHHLIAQTYKDVLDGLQHLIHGMLMADGHGLAGDGHVDGFGSQLGFQRGGVDVGLPLFQLLLDACPDGIRQLTHDGALLSGELAHLLQHSGQLALLAQQLDAKLFQSRRGGGSFQRCQGIGFDLL